MRYRSVDTIGAEHIGRRVTVRRRLDDGSISDVIGILEHADDASLTVRNRDDARVDIARTAIVAARVIRTQRPPMQAPG